MVLLVHEPADVPERNVVLRKSEIAPHALTGGFVIGKDVGIDGVVDNPRLRQPVLSIKPASGLGRAGKEVRGLRGNTIALVFVPCQPQRVRRRILRVVAMGNSYGNPKPLRNLEGDVIARIHVGMDKLVGVRTQEILDRAGVAGGMHPAPRHRENAATESEHLIVVIALPVPMDQEVDLQPVPVKMPVVIHDIALGTGAHEGTRHDVQDAFGQSPTWPSASRRDKRHHTDQDCPSAGGSGPST